MLETGLKTYDPVSSQRSKPKKFGIQTIKFNHFIHREILT